MPFRFRHLLLLPALLVSAPAFAIPDNFDQCVKNLQTRARDEGLSQHVVNDVLAKVSYVPRVIELDRRQPEFTQTFANYLGRRVTETRIEKGRELLAEYRPFLEKLTRKHGVPPQYLVAFWGLETNFGAYLGKMPALDSLATLACDKRRGRYFTSELLHALHLIDSEGIEVGDMEGSWAGALGQTQFMPSAYRRYAVDGDGDGVADLWHSVEDALASAANFLEQLGWQRGLRWGREVLLPKGFPYEQAGRGNSRPLREWKALGVTRADGRPLPDADVKAALLVPAGHRGPAFLVYRNFDVIMGWNRSEFYALSVGHLADRINGAGALRNPPPADAPRLSIAQVEQLQKRLNEQGFEAGEPDGILGSGTRAAIRRFEKSHGLIADGYPEPEILETLGITVE